MQQKQTLVLGGTLVVLLVIAWISGVFDRNPSNVDVPELDLPTSEVTHISVTLPDITFTVEKQGMQWFMREPVDMPADSATIARFLNELEELSLNNRATSNPDRYSIYGIDSTATSVSLTWSDGAEDLVISRQGRDYMSIYVQIGDNPNVYSTNGRVTVSQDLDRWRDRQILDLGSGTVMSARVTRPDDTYEVSLNNGVWMVNGQPGDSLQVASWIRRFSPLSADGFFDDIPVQILTDSSYRIDFSTSTNTTSSVQAMPAESAVAITSGGSQFTYRVYESRLNQLFPDPSSLTGE